jgi:hypothetical protein
VPQVFQFVARSGEQGLAAVVLGQFFALDPLLAAVGFAGQDQRLAVIANTPQDGGATILEQQQDRQLSAEMSFSSRRSRRACKPARAAARAAGPGSGVACAGAARHSGWRD